MSSADSDSFVAAAVDTLLQLADADTTPTSARTTASRIFANASIVRADSVWAEEIWLRRPANFFASVAAAVGVDALRTTFAEYPEEETRAILGGTAAGLYGFDRHLLESVAGRIGPSLDQIQTAA